MVYVDDAYCKIFGYEKEIQVDTKTKNRSGVNRLLLATCTHRS